MRFFFRTTGKFRCGFASELHVCFFSPSSSRAGGLKPARPFKSNPGVFRLIFFDEFQARG